MTHIDYTDCTALSWDEYYIGLLPEIAKKSKDPSTKVGCIITRPDNTVCSIGYNGLPRGLADTPERLACRERRYDLVIHAEMNAILNAREPLAGYTLYSLAPCIRCAVHIIQAGIGRVVMAPIDEERSKRWRVELGLFDEAGVEYVEISNKT